MVVSSASAVELLADATKLGDLVSAVGKSLGRPVKVCSSGDRLVTGRYSFDQPQQILRLAVEGHPVQYDGTSFLVGCHLPERVALSPQRPDLSASAGSPVVPSAAVSAPAPPVSIPSAYLFARVRYRDPAMIVSTLAKLPGLSVIADPDVPGPLLLAGAASVVAQASRFLDALDKCPVQLEVEALVISSSEETARSRALGVQLRDAGSFTVGSFDPLASAVVTIPGLRVFLDADRSTGEFRQNASLKSRVVVGETLSLVDGQEVPVRASTSVTDRETRTDVVYRNVGHQLSLTLDAVDAEAIVTVEHSLSSQLASSQLGPSFATRSTKSTMRVPLGKAAVVALSGLDSASRDKSRGIFARSDRRSLGRSGSFLVFALSDVPCAGGAAAGERPQPDAAPPAPRRRSRNMQGQ